MCATAQVVFQPEVVVLAFVVAQNVGSLHYQEGTVHLLTMALVVVQVEDDHCVSHTVQRHLLLLRQHLTEHQ
jgi:hypothetical protein